MGTLATEMAAMLIDKERARLIQEANDIADAATLFARNPDSGIACDDAERIAHAVRAFAQRAAKVRAMRDVVDLYEAETRTQQ